MKNSSQELTVTKIFLEKEEVCKAKVEINGNEVVIEVDSEREAAALHRNLSQVVFKGWAKTVVQANKIVATAKSAEVARKLGELVQRIPQHWTER